MMPALFSTGNIEWGTPSPLFGLLNREFHFTVDVCATSLNRKVETYFSSEQDGLAQKWTGSCWMNPPYGRKIHLWVKKARQESSTCASVVCLLPARTDTTWWQDHVMRAQEIRFVRGRLTFEGADAPAPFPSAVVIFSHSAKSSAGPRVIAWDWHAVLDRRLGIRHEE